MNSKAYWKSLVINQSMGFHWVISDIESIHVRFVTANTIQLHQLLHLKGNYRHPTLVTSICEVINLDHSKSFDVYSTENSVDVFPFISQFMYHLLLKLGFSEHWIAFVTGFGGANGFISVIIWWLVVSHSEVVAVGKGVVHFINNQFVKVVIALWLFHHWFRAVVFKFIVHIAYKVNNFLKCLPICLYKWWSNLISEFIFILFPCGTQWLLNVMINLPI